MLDGASWCLIVRVRPRTFRSDDVEHFSASGIAHHGNAVQGLLHRWFGCRPDSYQLFKLISCILVDISWYDLRVWINFASPKGLRTGQIKTGAPCRSERLAKCLDVNEKGCEATAPVSQCEFSSSFFAVQVQSAPAYWGGTGFSCVFRWFLRKNYKFSNFRAMYTSSNPSHAEAGTSFRNPKWLTDFSNRVRCTWYLPNWKYRNLNFFEQLVLSICFFLESITGSKLQYMNFKL